MLKATIQDKKNFLKECSNKLIKDFVKQISDIRDMFKNDDSGLPALMAEVNDSINKLKETDRFIEKEVELCEYRVNKCEKEIGYHLLGDKRKEENVVKNEEEEHCEKESKNNVSGSVSDKHSQSGDKESEQSKSEEMSDAD